MIEYRIFDYEKDMQYVDSLLHSSSLAHGIKPMTREWFIWKYISSPYGRAILVCAFDGSTVVGCTAFGIDLCCYNDIVFNAVQSYENFVHPNFQHKGIFRRMLKLACDEVEKRKIVLGYCFPNDNSLPAYLNFGWSLKPIIKYKIFFVNYLHVISRFTDLKKTFIKDSSNFEVLNKPISEFSGLMKKTKTVYSIWNSEYIHWRFFSFPNSNYQYVDNENYFAIARMGYRGKLKEAQIIWIYPKNGNYDINHVRDFLSFLIHKVEPDFISITLSIYNPLMFNLPNSFISVPNHVNFTNYCWKNALFEERRNVMQFSISSVNFHTY